MTPKADHNELIIARTVRERAWAYDAWMSRLSWGAMRRLANRPVAEGGLGYDLSEQACRSLVEQAKTDRGDLTMSRAERIERQAAEIDERARSARHDFTAAYARAAALDRAIDMFEVDSVEDAKVLGGMVANRAALAADLERADKRLDAVHAREARLFGLDAPIEAKLEVTNRDAVDAELDAMLARLDPPKKQRARDAG